MSRRIILVCTLSSVVLLNACYSFAQAETALKQSGRRRDNTICIKNAHVELYIDSASLALVDIYDLVNNISYVTEPGNTLFSFTFQNPAIDLAESDRTVSINGTQAKDKSFSLSDTPQGKLLSLHYDNCPTDLVGHTLNITVEVELQDGSSLLKWALKVDGDTAFTSLANEGSSTYTLDKVVFPILSGLGSDLPESNQKDYVVKGVGSGIPTALPRENFVCGQDFPGSGLQLLSYCDGLNVGGLYFAAEDAKGFRKTLVCTPMKSKKAFVWYVIHYGDGRFTNEHWELPYQVACGPISGDWYDAAKVYRQWIMAARDIKPLYKRGLPEWLVELAIWYQGQDRNLPELEMRPLVEKLIRVRERLGVPIGFHWYLWHNDRRQDHRYPDYFPPQPGFKAALNELSEHGIYPMPYINVEIFDMLADSWKTDNAKLWASRDAHGRLNHVTDWEHNDYKNVNMCISTEYWQDRIFDCVERLCRDYSAPAVYLDELPVTIACFANNHPHRQHGGDYITNGTRKLLSRIKHAYPQVVLCGELLEEVYIDQIDLQLNWADVSPERLPMFQAALGDCTLEMGLDIYDIDLPIESFAAKCGFMFVRGRQMWICEDVMDLSGDNHAEQVKLLKRIALARRDAKNFLALGEFLREPVIADNVKREVAWGSFLLQEQNTQLVPAIWSACYRAPDETVGIALFNATQREQEVEVEVNFKDWHLAKGRAKVVREHSNGKWINRSETLGTTIRTTISPYSPSVIEISP